MNGASSRDLDASQLRIGARIAPLFAMLALLAGLMASCGDHGVSDPSGLEPGVGAHVVVRFAATDDSGNILGEAERGSEDSILVECTTLDGRVVGVGRTSDGDVGFSLSGWGGVYRLSSRVTPAIGDTTDEVETLNAGFIELRGRDLIARPNPFVFGVRLDFSVSTAQTARVQVVSPAGTVLRTLAHATFARGNHEIVWDGTSDAGEQVAPGTYWAVFIGTTEEKAVALSLEAPPVARP